MSRQAYRGAHAPYNFVPFPKQVKIRYEHYEDLPKHDGSGPTGETLLCGEVSFEIEAKTPILVAQGVGKESGNKDGDTEKKQYRFNKSIDSRYEIPGSTLRGLLRQTIGIIGHSDLTKGIEQDIFLMYRGLANSDQKGLKQRKKEYAEIINKENVRAGYIRRKEENGQVMYEIIPAQEINGKTYTFVREQQLYLENVLPRSGIHPMYTHEIVELEKIGRPKPPAKQVILNPKSLPLKDKEEILSNYKEQLAKYNKMLTENPSPGGEKLKELKHMYIKLYELYYAYLKLCQNKTFKPYYLKDVTVYITDDGRYSFREGRGKAYSCALMASGFMQKKQSHYIIHPADETKTPIPLSEKDVKLYEFDLETKGKRIKNREFYALPKKDEMKPCFYYRRERQTYFGFTPNMRIFYKYSIGEGLPKYTYKGFDYVDALFGFTNRKIGEKKVSVSYAGRLSFKSAVAVGDPKPMKAVEVIPGQPRLSAIAMYIEQNDKERLLTMNDKGYKWRGIKQYWLKPDFKKPEANLKGAKENVKTKAWLHMLPKGTRFQATIRFDRLQRDELGLLLAALTWPKHQTIGMGKPYGAGCVTFSNIKLRLDTVDYRLDHYFENLFVEVDESKFESYIEAFKEEMKFICEDVRQSPPVRIFLAMRDRPYDFDTDYMPLTGPRQSQKPSYQSMLPLPSVEFLLGMTPSPTQGRKERPPQPFKPQSHKTSRRRFAPQQAIDERWSALKNFKFNQDNEE